MWVKYTQGMEKCLVRNCYVSIDYDYHLVLVLLLM